ncbi:hypothetical protein DC083_05680 [Ignatzschineria ureiclastica]|uniref:Uncharacterized protein n=1 Tax=Ignatzschineria ureiclastica TaxID=472582 RepID=A0A2U2AFI3_9GAMM|nr:hypothetical protein DC083_05680 [Ignatzschineria ureiclastica]
MPDRTASLLITADAPAFQSASFEPILLYLIAGGNNSVLAIIPPGSWGKFIAKRLIIAHLRARGSAGLASILSRRESDFIENK